MTEQEHTAEMLRRLAWDVANGLDYGTKSRIVQRTEVLARGCLRIVTKEGEYYDVVITRAGIPAQYKKVEKVRKNLVFAFTCLLLPLGGVWVW